MCRASTLENWIREFERFSPDIDVQAYHGSQAERAMLRSELSTMHKKGKLEVVLASYSQVGSQDDLSFLRKKIEFEVSCAVKPDAGSEPRTRLTRTDVHL